MTHPSKNSLFMFAAFIIGAFTNYLFNISMGWLLTPEQYGMLGVSISFILILSLFVNSAFPLTVTKFISGSSEDHVKYRVFKSGLAGNLIIALAMSVLFYFGYASGVIELGSGYNLLVICIILTVLLTSANVVFASILQGMFRFRMLASLGVIVTFVKLASAVMLVRAGSGVLGAVLSFPVSMLTGLGLAVVFTKDFTFWKTKGWAGTNIYFFALPMFFGTLGTTLLMNIDIIGVKFLTEGTLSDALSGYYRAALILAQLPVFISLALMHVLFPYISKHGKNEQYSIKSIKYASLFILPLAFLIAAAPEAFISIIFPSAYTAGAAALSIVALGMGFLVMIIVFTNIFQARHAPGIPAAVLSISVIIEIISLIKLVPLYGIVGAAASTAIACAFGFVILAAMYIAKYNLKLEYVIIVKTLISFSLALSLMYVLPHTKLISLIATLFLIGVVYLISLAVFNLITEEDTSIFFSGLPDRKTIRMTEKIINSLIRTFNRA